jgi:hypothetical protein
MMNDAVSQAYIYALEHMNMPNIIHGLREAINNPGKEHKIVLFDYYRTEQYWEDGYWVRQQLQDGTYLDETFQDGLFDILKQMFGMSLRTTYIYDRRRYSEDGRRNHHVRQVVLLVV